MHMGNETHGAVWARGATQGVWVREALAGEAALAGALPQGPPVQLLYVLEHWRWLIVHQALPVCQTALPLIWVILAGTLTVRLANVLRCKRAVDFAFPADLATLYSHFQGRLWPGTLIWANVFFFREVGTITNLCC